MRALFKQIMKGSGTPVLQTCEGGEETILSAGNIWTSAHARRIELSERGLEPGAVLCSDVGGFEAVIDFVACAIGAFVYLPVTTSRLWALQRRLVAEPLACEAGILFVAGDGAAEHYPHTLPAELAAISRTQGAQLALYRNESRPLAGVSVFTGAQLAAWLNLLSIRLGTPKGGTRLTYGVVHHDPGLVTDLLLGLYNRQTIYIRKPDRSARQTMLREVFDLEVDDLVLAPLMLDGLERAVSNLSLERLARLRRIRFHNGGRALSARQAGIASSLFERVFVEALPPDCGPRGSH